MPRYGGQHAHLTEEERQQFEAEGRRPSIRFRVLKIKRIRSMIWLKVKFHSIQTI